MKSRLLLTLPLLSLAVLVAQAQDNNTPSPAAPAQTPAPAPATGQPPAAAPAHNRPHTPLEKQMSRIRRAMRGLKGQISDPTKNESSLDLVATIRSACVTALDLNPAKAEDFSGDAKQQFLDHYRAAMKDFIASVDKLSAALKAGDNATATKIYQDLPKEEKKDHKEFRRPEKD